MARCRQGLPKHLALPILGVMSLHRDVQLHRVRIIILQANAEVANCRRLVAADTQKVQQSPADRQNAL